MKTIHSLAPVATITNKRIDWTNTLAIYAPEPERVTAFSVTGITGDIVEARLTYGRAGSLVLTFHRYRESADDDLLGHTLFVLPPSGPPWTIYSETQSEFCGVDDDGDAIIAPVDTSIRFRGLVLDGVALVRLMLVVHDRLVPPSLIAS